MDPTLVRRGRGAGGGGGGVAGQALPIVGGILAEDINMRIVAGNATDAGIRAIEALAVGEAVGLKADRQFAAPVIANHRLPGAMALPAEV